MAKHEKYYSASSIGSLTKLERLENGAVAKGEDGLPIRRVDLASVYSNHIVKNNFGGNRFGANSIYAEAGTQLHNYAEATLSYLHENYGSLTADNINASIEQAMARNESMLTHHVAKVYASKLKDPIRDIVSDVYFDKSGNRKAPGDILFASEPQLNTILDHKKGLGFEGAPDLVYYDKTTNTVKIPDLKTTFETTSDAHLRSKYGSGVQGHGYAVLVHDNFKKTLGIDTPEDVKYQTEYLIVPPETEGSKSYIKTKTQHYDKHGIEKARANLLAIETDIQLAKARMIRHEEIGGMEYAKQYLASTLGTDVCKPGNCPTCAAKLYCPNRNYQELVDEMNGNIWTSGNQQSTPSEKQAQVTDALAKDSGVSVEYKAAMDNIAAAKARSKFSVEDMKGKPNSVTALMFQHNRFIDDSYSAYANNVTELDPRLKMAANPEGNINAADYSSALGAQEHLPSSILDDNLHPRWMNKKYGQQFASHIESFAKNVITLTADQFSISPKALSETVMQRVFQSKKFAASIDDHIKQIVTEKLRTKAKLSTITAGDVHQIIDNIGTYIDNADLIKTIGTHVQMSTLNIIEQQTSKVSQMVRDKGIVPKQGESAAEALRWYMNKNGNFDELVQSTFEKVHRSPSFSGTLSKFSLSEKRFPLPMMVAAMFLSYAGAQTTAQNMARHAVDKGEDYRRYQNSEIREGDHAGVFSMALRLTSSAFGSGFQKFRTTYQDVANKALMNNNLFKVFKDATTKAAASAKNATDSFSFWKIYDSVVKAPTGVKAAFGIAAAAAIVLPIVKSNREIGKDEAARKKRLKKLMYGKTKSKGDSTSYQKSSDLRAGYKMHTGFGSPFNIGVFEAMIVGLSRILSEDLPGIISKSASTAGRVEQFFEDKANKAISTVRRSAYAMNVENVNKNHTNAVMTRLYEDQATLRTGEERTIDVMKAQRESDFHTFGVERANSSLHRFEDQMTAIDVQAKLAPDRLNMSLEKKAITAAAEDSGILDTVPVKKYSPVGYSIPDPSPRRAGYLVYRGTPRNDFRFVEQKIVGHRIEAPSNTFTKMRTISGSPKTDLRVSALTRKDYSRSKAGSVSASVSKIAYGKSKNMSNINASSNFIERIMTQTRSNVLPGITDFLHSKHGGEAMSLMSDVPKLAHSSSSIVHAQVAAGSGATIIHTVSSDARSVSTGSVVRSNKSSYREATAAERYVSKKASADENRKRFRTHARLI